MRLILLTVGKPTDANYRALCRHYLHRLSFYIPSEWEVVRSLAIKSLSAAEVLAREAELLTTKIAPSAYVVALDRSGMEWDTRQWAQWLQQRLQSGHKSLIFVIGGPLGLDQAFLEKANCIISLSRLTFAHELAAVIVTEQLYRVFNLLHGGKYHK